jgi:hypothetical protein
VIEIKGRRDLSLQQVRAFLARRACRNSTCSTNGMVLRGRMFGMLCAKLCPSQLVLCASRGSKTKATLLAKRCCRCSKNNLVLAQGQ